MLEESGTSSAILKAVSAGRPRQVRLLIESGVRVSVVDDCIQGPLIRAVFIDNNRNQIKVVKLLLKYGAKVSQTDVVGRNALQWACIYGKDYLVSYLLAHRDVDLDLNQVDMNGCTALFHAASSGSAATVKRMVDALLKYSLSVDIPNFNGMTPLMQAMRGGHDVSASILIHQGNASTTVRDREFRSAYDWAEMRPKKVIQTTKQQSFLPTIPNKVSNMIAYREQNAVRQRRVGASDDDDEYDSLYGSDDSVSYVTFDDENQTIDGSAISKMHSSYKSIQYPSPEPATGDRNELFKSPSINNLDDNDETLNNKLQYKELRKLYDYLQHQLTDSFRPGYDILHKNAKETAAPHGKVEDDREMCNAECCNGNPVAGDRALVFSEESIQRVVQANRKNKKTDSKKDIRKF
ncbi:uncharacterized protein [Antedon mediterranea]|uniref:uncharacterized protein n=1 Tax=Antedon mediterranea TaxID=105859 RepID=UPI003AF77698